MFGWFKPKLPPQEEMHRNRRLYRESIVRKIHRLDGYGRQICRMQVLDEHQHFLQEFGTPSRFLDLPPEQRNVFLAKLVERSEVYERRGERKSALGVIAFGVWLDCLCFGEPEEAERFWASL
ncbi:hypothetical protein DFH01_06775 [Falsiroseomonas bella]|uniref:Uncharacterized protein n=1 Tax=Falsiroseomonas bella TaxID=2184016 RepID=A0A317FIL9_9PROT|nr:hypothetical protein [Falsiroseomonas bella]PWS38944.1 hypothetical protein DFH01_06775 [Falsiroseomonas bella]